MAEKDHTKAVVKWFKRRYPKYAGCLIGIPNGTKLHGSTLERQKQASSLKSEGMKPGASDLFIAIPAGPYHGLWLEMKDVGKKESSLSDNQKAHLKKMSEVGYKAEWAAGFDEAKKVIEEYLWRFK